MTRKNTVRFLLSLVLSGVCLTWAFRRVDMAQVAAVLRSVRVPYVILYGMALAAIQAFRAFRWEVLTRPFAPMSKSDVWRVSNLGGMLVMLLPLRLGEFARPLLMKRANGASFTSAMAASVVERVLDGLLVVLLFYASTIQLQAPYAVPTELAVAAKLALAFFVSVLVVLLVAMFLHDPFTRLVRAVAGKFSPSLGEKVITLIDAFVAGLRALPDARAVFALVVWTLLYWAANGLGLYWLMCAFGWSLPFVAAFVLVCVLVIGIMIPAGPGMLGTYQGALVAGLGIFGVDRVAAIAYTFVAYPLNLLVVIGFGLPYLFGRGKLRMGDLLAASEQTAAQAPQPVPRSTTC